MKRLFAVFTLCATALIAASAVSSPAAADGRHDTRRHAGQSDRQTSRAFTDRGEHRRGFRDHRDRRYYKFRRHHHARRYSHRHGYGYGPPRYRHGTRMGSPYAFTFDGAQFVFRFD